MERRCPTVNYAAKERAWRMTASTEMPGLIYAYTLDGKGGCSEIGWDEIKRSGRHAPQWLHLKYTDEDVQTWLFDESGLPEIICQALIEDDVRPRMLPYNNGLLLVLRSVNYNPGSDPEDMVALRMWVEESRIITMRHRKVTAIDDIKNALLGNKGPQSVSDFVVEVCSLITGRITEVVSGLVDKADELEDMLLSKESHELRTELSGLRRQAIALRRYIAPQREVLSRLYNQPFEWADNGFKSLIREQHEATLRLLEDLDSARERAGITQEELNGALAENMNRTMYLLSLVAALFLPLGFLTGLFGINIGGMPGTESKWAFSIFCAVLAFVVVVQLLYFKRKKFM